MSSRSWATLLQQYNAENPIESKTEEDLENDVEKELHSIMMERLEEEYKVQPSLKLLPRFYYRRPGADNELHQSVQRESRTRFLSKKHLLLLSNEELELMADVLNDQSVAATVDAFTGQTEQRINYHNFSMVPQIMVAEVEEMTLGREGSADQVGSSSETGLSKTSAEDKLDKESTEATMANAPASQDAAQDEIDSVAGQNSEFLLLKFEQFFTPSNFLKFAQDEQGCVSTQQFLQFVVSQVSLTQTRISLAMYNDDGSGYLREEDVENYVFELMHTIPRLAPVCENKAFCPYYVFTAVRKFFFFLDPLRRGRISIPSMLTSPVLAELFELRADELPNGAEETNWFSPWAAYRVYETFLALDTDHNGLLSQSELAYYGNGTLTDAFLARVFQEHPTYEGEMDYKAFLEFVLATENRDHPNSLRYFLKALDLRKKQYLDAFSINYHLNAIMAKLEEHGQEPVNIADVKDEIFDMVKPKHHLYIDLDDLVRSNVGPTVVWILSDATGFWRHDNREYLVSQGGSG